MMKRNQPLVLLIMYLLSLLNAGAQPQKDLTDFIKQKFLEYSVAVPREEIFLHSDRDEYIAGEDLWFNVYLIDRQSNKPLGVDKIAYVELLDTENRPIVQKRIFVNNGFGPGQIVLPDTLGSGSYTIRAYTNWMKNFLPENCFMKDLRIYNALSKEAFHKKIYSYSHLKTESLSGKSVVSENGLILKVNNFKPEILEINVFTDIRYRTNNDNTIYLLIQTHGVINHLSREKIYTDSSGINISKKELIPGISQISIFDSNGKPLCDRFIYTPLKRNQTLIVTSSGTFNKRDKIALDLALETIDPNASFVSNFSISVAPYTGGSGSLDLEDYMIFGSEFGLLPGSILKAGKINDMSPEKLDSLLLTVKSSWIDWDKILSGDLPFIKYPVEDEWHWLPGKLVTLDQKPPESEEYVLLSTPGKVAEFQYARTDEQGNFNFRIPVDESIKDLVIQLDDVTKKHKINVESSFSDKYLNSEVLPDLSEKSFPDYISGWKVNYQVNRIYESTFTGEKLVPEIRSIMPRRFYGKPDVELILADYIKLPVMEEVFFELLPGVSLRNRKTDYDLSVADPLTKKNYGVSPGMLVDGVIIKDASNIGNIDPDIVDRIDVVKEKYFVGNYLFYGIVNVITKANDFSSVTLPDYAIRMQYRVIDPVWSFASPDYSVAGSKENHIPDFRNTLYWNPLIKPDKNGKATIEFWSSDLVSDYEINIEGFGFNGTPISYKKVIKVR